MFLFLPLMKATVTHSYLTSMLVFERSLTSHFKHGRQTWKKLILTNSARDFLEKKSWIHSLTTYQSLPPDVPPQLDLGHQVLQIDHTQFNCLVTLLSSSKCSFWNDFYKLTKSSRHMPWCFFASLKWMELLNNNNCCFAPLRTQYRLETCCCFYSVMFFPSEMEGLNQMTNGLLTQKRSYVFILVAKKTKRFGDIDRKNMHPLCFFEGSERQQVPGEPFEKSILESEIKCWIAWSLKQGQLFLRRLSHHWTALNPIHAQVQKCFFFFSQYYDDILNPKEHFLVTFDLSHSILWVWSERGFVVLRTMACCTKVFFFL